MRNQSVALLALLLISALVSQVFPPPAEPQQMVNLLSNGDFESGVSGWEGISAGQLVSGDAPSGQTAVRLTGGEASQGWIQLTPGKKYVLTAWFKWTSFSGQDWGYDRIAIFDSGWDEVAALNKPHRTYEQGKWHKLALSFTAGDPTIRVSFGVFGPQEQVEIYFDNFELFRREENFAPQTALQASAVQGEAPFSVGFTANAADADGAIQHYNWDFGDGSAATEPNSTHVFQSRGVFPVTLTVWDNDGASAQQAVNITVTDLTSPSVQSQAPASQESLSSSDEKFSLSGVASSQDGARITRVVWDNLSTGEAGIVDIAPSSNLRWSAGPVDLKPGKNEILVTATDEQGRVGVERLFVNRALRQPAVRNLLPSSKSVRVYEKFELSFDLDTLAGLPFYRYDPAPPPGIAAGTGVSVEGIFTTPGGKTLVQPGFFAVKVNRVRCGEKSFCYQQANEGRWLVRFSPQEVGSYQVSLRIEDASGKTTLPAGSFQAIEPVRPGFIRVSQRDPRYFEFSNGELFWPNGPATGPDYRQYKDTGQNLERPWLGGTGAYSTNFARWMSTGKDMGNEGFDSQLSFQQHYPGRQLSQVIRAPEAGRLWLGWLNGEPYRPLLKAGQQYQVLVRLKTQDIHGPVDPAYPYGFVIKKHGWPSDSFEEDNRQTPSFIPIVSKNLDWHTIVVRYTATERDADNSKPYIALYLDNVSAGQVYIDQFSLREVLADGSLGGELIVNSNANLQTYVDPAAAASIDWQVEQGEQNGVYFKYVVHDKRDWIQNHLLKSGFFAEEGDGYYQGSGTAAHWLLEQWWRYLIARWGYSTAVHSWELNNEGPPDDPAHFQLAQDFAQFMHQNDAHPHLVTTSFWSGWQPQFWGDHQKYPDVDYADIHEYIKDRQYAIDLVQWQLDSAAQVYQEPVGKPIMRGETGIGGPSDDFFAQLQEPNDGTWYHNLLWSQLGPNVLYNPNYWWSEHRKQIDKEAISAAFYHFVSGLDLNAGGYMGLEAHSDNPNLRIIGQMNPVAGKAHLWVQNSGHSWQNVLSAGPIASQSGTIFIQNMQEGLYQVEWWDTRAGEVFRVENVPTDPSGNLSLRIDKLADDLAIKITRQ